MNFKKFLPWIAAVVIIGGYSYVKGINNNAVGYEQGINEAWVMSKLPTKEEMT
jgi:LemA protein